MYAGHLTPDTVGVEAWDIGNRWRATPPGERLWPLDRASSGRVLSVHGGGWALGSARADRAWTSQLAARGLEVIATGYSLAPEAAFPTAVGECAESIRAVADDPGAPHVIAAYSAGANIAAGALLYLDDAGWRPKRVRMLLAYGIFDFLTLDTDPGGGNRLPELWRTAYLGSGASPLQAHPYASPLRAARRLPPGDYLLVCGTEDHLLAQTERMAEALDDDRHKKVELLIVPRAVHGFLKAAAPLDAERAAIDAVLQFCGAGS